MRIDGLIFDLDGVLIDSIPAQIAAWTETFARYGIAFDESMYRACVDGRPALDAVRAMMPEASESRVSDAVAFKETAYLRRAEEGACPPFESARAFVKSSYAAHIPMAVASSSEHAREILSRNGLIRYFKSVVCGDDVVHGKPAPDIFLKAAGDIDCRPENVVVFEDSVSGISAAKSGGFYCVGISHGRSNADIANADRVVSSLSRIELNTLGL